jgi:hypothetical protein
VILTDEQILEICLKPFNSACLLSGAENQNNHKVHITGEGYKERIKQIIGYENSQDYTHKKELSKPVTKHIYKAIIDELSRWQNTDSTVKTYDIPSKPKQKKFENVLDNCWKGESITDFINGFFNQALYTEFNGFILIDKPALIIEDGITYEIVNGYKYISDGDPKPYIIFKALSDVYDYKITGNKVEYVIFKRKLTTGKEQLRYLDDVRDLLINNINGQWVIDQESIIKLEYGIPVCIVSTKNKTNLNDEVKTSYIEQTLQLADTYLTLYAEHVMTSVRHAHPILYILGQTCDYVDSEGRECDGGTLGMNTNGKEIKCPRCNGTGKKGPRDSGDVYLLPNVDADGKPYSVASVGGLIESPVSTITDQRTELDWLEKKIYLSALGQKDFSELNLKTATEVIVGYKGEENIINIIIKNIEYVETFITNMMGKMYLGEGYKSCYIHIGRRLNLRDENVINNEIKSAKDIGASISYINQLYREMIVSKYQNSPEALERALLLFEIEPFPELTTEEVLKTSYINNGLKWLKINFNEAIKRFEIENGSILFFEKENEKRIRSIKNILLSYQQDSEAPGNDESVNPQTGDTNEIGEI